MAERSVLEPVLSITREEFTERMRRLGWLYAVDFHPWQQRESAVESWLTQNDLHHVVSIIARELLKHGSTDRWVVAYLQAIDQRGTVGFQPLGIPKKNKDGT